MLLSLNCLDCEDDGSCGFMSLKLDVRRKFGFLWFPISIAPPPLNPANPLLSTISTQSAVRSRHLELPPFLWGDTWGAKTNSTLGLDLSGVTLEVCGGCSEDGDAIRKLLWVLSTWGPSWGVEWMNPVGVGIGEAVGEADVSTKVSWTGLDETWYSCVASFNPFFFISFNCCWANRYLENSEEVILHMEIRKIGCKTVF